MSQQADSPNDRLVPAGTEDAVNGAPSNRPATVDLQKAGERPVNPKPGTRRRRSRRYRFSLRYPWLGPAVWIASSLYFLVTVIVAWNWNPAYSVAQDTISDLGNNKCATYGGRYVCSTRHVLMNVAFIGLGLVMMSGSLLIHQEFTERDDVNRRVALAAFSLMVIAGVGACMVGFFPGDTFGAAHATGAGLAIAGGNLCMFILGRVLPLPDALRRSMTLWPAVALTAAILFAFNRDLGIGSGAMERIAQYPETLWLISFGIYISSNHYSRSHALVAGKPVVLNRPGRPSRSARKAEWSRLT